VKRDMKKKTKITISQNEIESDSEENKWYPKSGKI
jgi:hypothetical protein